MKKLELIFENEIGKSATYTVDNPVEPVNPANVSAAMDDIIAQDVFMTSGGSVVSKKAARIVERNVTEVDIV